MQKLKRMVTGLGCDDKAYEIVFNSEVCGDSAIEVAYLRVFIEE